MFSQPQTRWGAFGIHLLISLAIFLILAAIIVFVWYPGFLFQTDGGWQGIRLIAGVDFIIGPVLTLIVYKLGKPSLKMDLTLIGLLQVACLAYGSYLVYQQKPLAVIYADGSYYTMSEGTFEMNSMDWRSIPLIADAKKPAWIFVDLPEEKVARSQARIKQITGGLFHTRKENYLPYADNISRVEKLGINQADLNVPAKELTQVPEHILFYPLAARYSDGFLGVDTRDGKVVELIRKKPPASLEALQQ